jgi:hypothetical protein
MSDMDMSSNGLYIISLRSELESAFFERIAIGFSFLLVSKAFRLRRMF